MVTRQLTPLPSEHDTLSQCRFNVGPPSATLVQHCTCIRLLLYSSVLYIITLSQRLVTGRGPVVNGRRGAISASVYNTRALQARYIIVELRSMSGSKINVRNLRV